MSLLAYGGIDLDSVVRILVLLAGLFLIYAVFSCNTCYAVIVKYLIRVLSIVSLLVLLFLFFCNHYNQYLGTFGSAAIVVLLHVFTFAANSILQSTCAKPACVVDSISLSITPA